MLQQFILSFSEYDKYSNKKSEIRCDNCNSKDLVRDYNEDLVHFSVHPSLSECKTLQHYAEKQSKKYGKEKCQKMSEDFTSYKKNKVGGIKNLPQGMTRIKKAQDFKTYNSKKPKGKPN